MLWQRFWLELCTKQVVNARAFAYQVLPFNSSGIYLSGMGIVQADSCLNCEQIHTLFNSLWGLEGGPGGVDGYFWPEAHNLHVTVRHFFTPPALFLIF